MTGNFSNFDNDHFFKDYYFKPWTRCPPYFLVSFLNIISAKFITGISMSRAKIPAAIIVKKVSTTNN